MICTNVNKDCLSATALSMVTDVTRFCFYGSASFYIYTVQCDTAKITAQLHTPIIGTIAGFCL